MEDIEKGVLKSTLLIRVRTLPPYLQSILTVCKIDFSDDFHLALVCTRESQRRGDPCMRGQAKICHFRTSASLNGAQDGWPGNGMCNCLYSRAGMGSLH